MNIIILRKQPVHWEANQKINMDTAHCSLCMWRSVEDNLRTDQCIYCNHKHPFVIKYIPNNSATYKCIMCQKSFKQSNETRVFKS